MSYDTMNFCTATVVTAAIEDMAELSGRPIAEVRKEIFESKAYECLLDFDSKLWAEGPDYFRDFHRRVTEKSAKG